MNDFILVLMYKRLKDLVAKLISVKGVFAGVMSYVYFTSPSEATLLGVCIAWAIFIGAREFAKIKGVLPVLGK